MALYDCFMYFDEDMLLDIRLNILNETVDKFVIAEATKTHSGKDKKLNFDIKNFLKFKDKINYLVIDDLPQNLSKYKKGLSESHLRDQYQRNSLSRGLVGWDENDLVMNVIFKSFSTIFITKSSNDILGSHFKFFFALE